VVRARKRPRKAARALVRLEGQRAVPGAALREWRAERGLRLNQLGPRRRVASQRGTGSRPREAISDGPFNQSRRAMASAPPCGVAGALVQVCGEAQASARPALLR
jgi:hypothetical protein